MRLTILLMLLWIHSYSQKQLDAHRIESEITIDGILDEEAWDQAAVATNFISISPNPGLDPEQQSIVKVLYDDEAIYISATMEEVSRDSILTQLTQRDDIGNTDAFGILLDTYKNGTDGIILLIGATGVQYDARKENNGNEDNDWDAVWFSAVDLRDDGWSCELKIPYAAIRFPDAEEQNWSMNFLRIQRRKNLQTAWNPIDPAINGIFTQGGILKNIKNIEPPTRISLTPYISTYALHYHDKNANPINSTGYSYNAGMDVKYGINDAFTLDMTLIPDFGQVEADDLVVNLSPFEVQLSEKRPFFTEGLELFNKANIFYTRRIGGTAFNYYDVEDQLGEGEEILANPQIPQLYNATKISGRNSNGLGIGVFNAVEGGAEATILDTETNNTRTIKTHPLTNYSVIVFDQNLRNNSYVSLINTNVWRRGADYYDANVIATDIDIKDKKERFSFLGEGVYSLKSYSDEPNVAGHRLELGVQKISGNWRGGLFYEESSPTYDHNDLGFLRNNNIREVSGYVEYKIIDKKWILNRGNFWVDLESNLLYEPSVYTQTWLNFGFWTELSNFWNLNMWFNRASDYKDYFEPRTSDYSRHIIRPEFSGAGFWLGTDNRKKFRHSLNGNLYNVAEEERWGYFYAISPRYRFSDKFNAYLSWNYNMQHDDTGWVDDGDTGEIFIGQRDLKQITTFANLEYTFNDRMGLMFRSRHYWSSAAYNSFHELGNEGELLDTEYEGSYDFSSSFFSIDLGFNWRFAPGSDLILVWKNNISGFQEDPSLDYRSRSYMDGVNNLSNFPQQNSLSLRITYYLDQNNFRKWL